ncbi:MAG: hypothetical protein AB1918_07775 [Pseudomonadota bacterium]
MSDRIAITQGSAVLSMPRNAKGITLPDGATVMGPLRALPHPAGDYTIRAVMVDGPEPGPLEIGGTEPPAVEGDVVVIRRTVTPMGAEAVAELLASRKADAKAQVDAAAEAARQRWITPGAGQSMVYQQKATEARALKAGGAGPWPHLEAEVGITGPTADDVATIVLAMEDAWLGVSAQIEAQRLTAKRDITAAADLAAVEAVLAALAWPEPA